MRFTLVLLIFVAGVTLASSISNNSAIDTGFKSDSMPGDNSTPETKEMTDLDKHKTTTEATTPATKPTQPTTAPTKPTTEPTKPTTEPTKPTTEPTKPTTEPTKPTTEPTKPTTEPTKPTTEPTKPTTEPTKPTTEPTKPTTEPTKPTTVPPTPTVTPSPSPKPESWIVKDVNNTDCIIAAMVIKVIVPYKSANKTVNVEFSVDNVENATASGECGNVNETLVLNWNHITCTFKFNKKGKSSYTLGSVQVEIPVNDKIFPNNTMVNATKITLKYDTEVFDVPVNHSYTCTRDTALNLNGTTFNGTTPLNDTIQGTITISKVHIEAFGIGHDGKFSDSKDCSPFETPDIVPIVVGLVLAGLVVVVLIAYLVGRRRAQARGYLSM